MPFLLRVDMAIIVSTDYPINKIASKIRGYFINRIIRAKLPFSIYY